MKTFKGPKKYERVVTTILHAYNIPSHRAAVYDAVHDTGYPGLVIQQTRVDLYLDDRNQEEQITTLLSRLGFQ